MIVISAPRFQSTPLLPTNVNTGDNEEEWWTEESEDTEVTSETGSSSNSSTNLLQNRKYFPPKLKELIPGHIAAVEVLFVFLINCQT